MKSNVRAKEKFEAATLTRAPAPKLAVVAQDAVRDACGRWKNGQLEQLCTLAETEFCDYECPHGPGNK
jgi:hypothetical protein